MSKSSKRVRHFCAVYYQEDAAYVIERLKYLYNCGDLRNYYLIQHDPDIDDKQTHYHMCIEYWEAHSLTAVQKHFGIKDKEQGLREGKVQVCSDFRKYLRYLIHLDDKYKKQYHWTDVECTDSMRYLTKINSKNANTGSDFYITSDKCRNIIRNNRLLGWTEVFDIMCNHADLDQRLVQKTLYRMLYDYWREAHTEAQSEQVKYYINERGI